MATDMTLDRAIEQQINLGQKDPHAIYELLLSQLGDDLLEIAKPYLADFVSEMARRKLNSLRRSTIAKINASSVRTGEIKLRSLWVPSEDGMIVYKRVADMTAVDFDARASYLERMAQGILNHAQWCRDVAKELRARNLMTAAKLDKFPELVDEKS